MEKTKNDLPYYLRIDKQKNGVPVIIKKAFRLSELPQMSFLLFVYGGALYLMLSVEVFWGFNWHTLGIFTMSIVNTVFLLLFLWGLFGETKITLEPEYLLKKTLNKKLCIPEKDIISIFANGPQELWANLHNGESIILIGYLGRGEASQHLATFINTYYGLDEKPKNQ